MKKHINVVLVSIVLGGTVLFSFNNCSDDVSFKQISDYTLDASSEAGLIDRLPPEEVYVKRPLTDLAENPALYQIFKCPDSEGVVICHFPENVESEVTQCVGVPSVKTHYGHIRDYAVDGEARIASDYLGPCRFPL